MARRASSHDRLEKLRAEADATEREKEEKRKAKAAAPAAPKKKRAAASPRKPARMMIVWAVCNAKGDEKCTYPYAHKAAAAAECARLTNSKGGAHALVKKRVPFEAQPTEAPPIE